LKVAVEAHPITPARETDPRGPLPGAAWLYLGVQDAAGSLLSDQDSRECSHVMNSALPLSSAARTGAGSN